MNLEIPFEVIEFLKKYNGTVVIKDREIWGLGGHIFIGDPKVSQKTKPSKQKQDIIGAVRSYLTPDGNKSIHRTMKGIVSELKAAGIKSNQNTIQATMNRAKKNGILFKKKDLWFVKE